MSNNNNLTEQVLECLMKHDSAKIITKLQENNLIEVDHSEATIRCILPFYAPSWLSQLQSATKAELEQLIGKEVSWEISQKITALHADSSKSNLPKIKNILVVASGKGGVGKSTVSVNLALALSANGAKVGILDADIYGPSIPTMLGVKNEQPQSTDGKTMSPISACGLVCNSIGFLVSDEQAMIWRGPKASSALNQVLNDTSWPELDYLVVDMPPGTGDIQLTMSQDVPVTSAVVVTTPQDIALVDAKKGVSMFNKVDVNVAGVVENMSFYACSQCGHQEAIFGTGGGKKLAEQFDLPFLGALPLHMSYREDTDQGNPTVHKGEQAELTAPYLQLAETLAINLYRDLNQAAEQINITQL